MISHEVSEMLDAPREAVFSLGADLPHLAALRSDLVSVLLVKERYDEKTFEVVDRARKERYTVVQRSRTPEKIVRDVRMKNLSAKVVYTLKQREHGTELTFAMTLDFGGYYRLLSPFIRSEIRKKMMELFLVPLKRLIESDQKNSLLGATATSSAA